MRSVVLAVLMSMAGLGSGAMAQPVPLQELPQILQLQTDQATAWRAYTDAEALGRADAVRQQQQAAVLNDLPTPARLDAMAVALQASEEALRRHAAATKAFYAVLSPEQRSIFDRLTRLPTPPSPMRTQRRPTGLIPSGRRLREPDADDLPPPAVAGQR